MEGREEGQRGEGKAIIGCKQKSMEDNTNTVWKGFVVGGGGERNAAPG